MLKMVLFYEFTLSAKSIHKHIGQHRSLLISINASQALQYTFAETDIVFRVLGYWHFVLQ